MTLVKKATKSDGARKQKKRVADNGQLKRLVGVTLGKVCAQRKLGFNLKVTRVFRKYGWIYFAVEPDRADVHAYEFAEALAAVEMRLRRYEHRKNVLIVPDVNDELL